MIHILIGTKAQLIKMAPVMLALVRAGIPYNFISTGQHRETMDDILGNFGLPGPNHRLYTGKDITSLPAMATWATAILWKTWRGRHRLFGRGRNDLVLVHGDTFSTLLGALIGRMMGRPVGHVESGLRSFNLFHPFPEEVVRLLTFRLATLLFCPGPWAVGNVQSMRAEKVDTCVNTLADALLLALTTVDAAGVDIPDVPFAIVTLHRFENLYRQAALERIVSIVERIARDKHIVFILHPPTEKKLREYALYERLAIMPEIELRPRYDYFRFIKLVSEADYLVSDGGSNQEECFFMGKPILLLRKATERQDGLGENAVLSNYDPDIIDDFVHNWQTYRRPEIFPSRSASDIIVERCRPFAE